MLKDKTIAFAGPWLASTKQQIELCAQLGAQVLVLSVDTSDTAQRDLHQTLRKISRGGTRIRIVDLGDGQISRLQDAMLQGQQEFGRLDGLYCDAGSSTTPNSDGSTFSRNVLQILPEDLQERFCRSFGWQLALVQHYVRIAAEQQHPGAVVLRTNPEALFAKTGQSLSAAFSAATVALVRGAAGEFKRHGVSINALNFAFDSDGGARASNGLAAVLPFLFSKQAASITGEIIGVEGTRMYAIQIRESVGAFCPPQLQDAAEFYRLWLKAKENA